MNEQEIEFETGFNHGYILTAHEPEMANAIITAAHDSKNVSEYAYGLSAGHDMYIVDNILPEKVKLSKPAKELESLNTPEKKFIMGFNMGHELAKYEPELLSKIVKQPNDKSEYFNGIVHGKKEYDYIKIRERLNGISNNNAPKKDITKNKGKER